MSMTTNPSEKTQSLASFREEHKDKAVTSFGVASNAAGTKRYEFLGCPSAHAITVETAKGTGAPGIEYIKFADWAHKGHQLTHLGTMLSSQGAMEAWYCQTDDIACYDTKS